MLVTHGSWTSSLVYIAIAIMVIYGLSGHYGEQTA